MSKATPPPQKTLEESIVAVCRMPVDYSVRQTSWNELEKESGYALHREEVTEKRLEDYLRAHPELLDDWVRHSEDQRSSPNWGICRPEGGRTQWSVVFYAGRGSDLNQDHRFDDAFRACAFFIKRTMEPAPGQGMGGCVGCLVVLTALMVVAIVVRICGR